MSATATIRYVSPSYGHAVTSSGWQFTCPACYWRSAIYRYHTGALHAKVGHVCPARPAAA